MDRNREARRVNMAASNGLSRRRHRSNSLRDSPEDDVVMETQETARLRDRKKERDRDRERERDRDRERERERERERDRMSSRSSKRRRGGERLIHGSSNREDGVGVGEDSSEESVNDDEDEDDDDAGVGASAAGLGGSSMRMLPPNHHHHHHHNNTSSLPSSSFSNHHHNNNNTNSNHHHRKSFSQPAKVFRAAPGQGTAASAAAPWKAHDEMIGVSVPRKARSVSTKRSHDCWASSGVGEQIHRQASTSPVRSNGPSGAAMMASASASPAPVSPPSSSTISVKKKMKPNGPKQRPPKSLSSSSKPASSAQEEIEIEIAEVLYGLLRQPQASGKQEMVGTDSMKMDSREMNSNKPTGDAKSRVSSPISNSPSTAVPQSSSAPQTNSSSSTTPMSAIAPKRKRPRPVKYEDENPSSVLPGRNSVVPSMTKVVENDQSTKIESNLDKNPGSSAENGSVGFDSLANQAVPSSADVQTELVKQENNSVSDAKPLTEASEGRDLGVTAKEEPRSPSKESNAGLRPGEDREGLTVSKANAKVSEVEAHREEKFQIDLMAPPPPLRSSPERDSEIDFGSVDPKSMVKDVETGLKPVVTEDDKAVKIAKEDINVEPEEKKVKVMAEVADSHKLNRERNIDLQLDLEKTDRESGSVSSSGNKQHHVQNQKQHQQPHSEKNAQPGSLPLPMSMASWPGGLPPMGYMAPIQGVVSMDGNSVPSAAIQPPHLLFGQPRPKRCATHCYIARNIHYHQQFTRMNPFWPAAPGSALQFGAKTCNVNVVPSPELHPGRGVNSVQDKGQSLAIFPPHSGKEKSSQSSNMVDTAQRKQILLQQALPPGAPNNILHGPAFIFPLSQQPGASGASVRPGNIKSPPAAGSTSASSTTSSASMSATAAAVAGATAMSFNYPNMPGNETQYLAILQNGAYPIPIPAHVGTNPAYRGAHPPAMPFFNGSFYSSQMLHPSALPPQQPPPSQSQQSQQGHQNPSISSGSSSSQKHLQNQQPRAHASGINGNGGNLQGFPGQKNLPLQSMQLKSRQQNLNHNVPLQTRQLESEGGGEESPSTADSRVSRANMSIYGQNFGLPMHPPPNFTLMTPASVTAANSTSNNPGDKKQQQQPQSHGSKPGVEPFQSQPFAMSFAFNGAAATPGLDISSIAQNHPFLQSLPEAARHGYYMPTAAAVNPAAQQKKNFRTSEEGKAGGNDGANVEEERKAMAGGKVTMTSGQSIAFSRSDLTDTPVSTMPGNVVIDTSARPLNLGSTPGRAAGSVMSAAMSTVAAAGVPQQIQRNQQQQQQMIQLHKQHQFAAAAAASGRSKAPATSNGSVYSDHISTSASMSSKFPSTISAFPQNLVQSSSSPAQSPQWKGSVRTAASQVSSPTLASTSSTLKNLPQQQIRTQQGHTQISFAANPKPSAASQGQPPPSNNQSPSPPMVVGSPTASSISKSAGGSPRTTSTSTSNKGGQTSSLSSQQAKNSPAVATQKSSPVGGRNIPSILGHPQSPISTSGSGSKPQLTQQHLQKQALQQQAQMQQEAQMYSAYMQAAQVQHAASSANNTSAAGRFYLQRHSGELPQQQSQGSSTSSSTGMLSLGPPTCLANTGTTDPAKAVAAAAAAVSANNMKGGSFPSLHAQFAAVQSSGKAHQLVPSFSFVHPVPSAVQVKPAEQKQPAGE